MCVMVIYKGNISNIYVYRALVVIETDMIDSRRLDHVTAKLHSVKRSHARGTKNIFTYFSFSQ